MHGPDSHREGRRAPNPGQDSLRVQAAKRRVLGVGVSVILFLLSSLFAFIAFLYGMPLFGENVAPLLVRIWAGVVVVGAAAVAAALALTGIWVMIKVLRAPESGWVVMPFGIAYSHPSVQLTIPWDDIETAGMATIGHRRFPGVRLRSYVRFESEADEVEQAYLRGAQRMGRVASWLAPLLRQGWLRSRQAEITSPSSFRSPADCMRWVRKNFGYDVIFFPPLGMRTRDFLALLQQHEHHAPCPPT